jgi:hypothetical protein
MSTASPQHAEHPDRSVRYEIRVEGRLEPRWVAWFDGMTLTPGADGTTVLLGDLADQAALHGVLGALRDLGLPLLSVVALDPDHGADSPSPTP